MTERKSRTREGSGKDAELAIGKEEMEREESQIWEKLREPVREGWLRWRSRDGVERVWERQQQPSGRQEQQGKPEAGISAYRESSGTVWDLSWNQIGQGNSGHLCDLHSRSQSFSFIPRPWAWGPLWFSLCTRLGLVEKQ